MTSPWRWSSTCAACSRQLEPREGTLEGLAVRCARCLSGPAPGESLLAGVTLLAHQPGAARWLAARPRALLADEQGLGKTIELLAALPAGAAVQVVTPAAGRGVWLDHLARHRPDLTGIAFARARDWRAPVPSEVVVSTWDGLPGGHDEGRIGHLILDEVDAAKGRSTRRNRRARALVARSAVAWGATGTPQRTTPEDLWQVLRLLGLDRYLVDAWPSWPAFARDLGHDGRDWGGRVAEHVPALLRRVLFGRERRDVLDLPGRTSETVEVALPDDARRVCDQAQALLAAAGVDLEQALERVLESSRGNLAAVAFSAACAALATAKVPALLALVEQHERTRQDPLLVWSRHRAPLQAVGSRPGWGLIQGGVLPAARARLAARLQAGELRGLALGVLAAGTALTLTAAHRCVWVDLSYSPGSNAQAAARVERIGQTRRIEDIYLIADHALDRHLHAILRRRAQTLRDVVSAARRQA